MDYSKEQKIFFSLLFIFIAGSLIFFVAFLALGNNQLSSPVWLMFILVDGGFIAFILLPSQGRMILRGKGKPVKERRWYPRTLEGIVSSGEDDRQAEGVIRSPARAVDPVLIITLLLIMGIAAVMYPSDYRREEWKAEETERLRNIYDMAESKLLDIEQVMIKTAETARGMAGEFQLDGIGRMERAELMRKIDSLATRKAQDIRPLTDLGIQVYSRGRERIAWGGEPSYLEEIGPDISGVRTFTDKTRLYTIMVTALSFPGGTVVVDLPVKINYMMKNRYFQKLSLEEELSGEQGAGITFHFRDEDSPAQAGGGDNARSSIVFNDPSGEMGIYGKVISSTGVPLSRLKVKGERFSRMVSRKGERKSLLAGILLTLTVTVLAVRIYRGYLVKMSRRKNRGWNLIIRVAALLFFLALIRYILLVLKIPSRILDSSALFDPAIFMDNMPGGILRTAGDFLITAFFMLIFVFGAIKVYRTFYPGELERSLPGQGDASWMKVAGRAALLSALLYLGTLAASILVSRVVVNSNPRLVGFDIDFFGLPGLSLHLALLFSISAIFITLIFACRLILLWGGGELKVTVIAVILLLVLLHRADPAMFIPAAALLIISARIFPILRKEEIITVMFSSFFLVLALSMLIYGTAEERYEQLKQNRVREMAYEFNHPEQSWLKDFLPEINADISQSRRHGSKVSSKSSSAAFEIWAESSLGKFDLPCLIEVYTREGERVSTFSLGIPVEITDGMQKEGRPTQSTQVKREQSETGSGTVFYFNSISPLYSAEGRLEGRVEIKIPYFYENPELLARTGPETPEIFHAREKGSLTRRVDEPQDLLVARVESGRIAASSSPYLNAGETLPAEDREWFELAAGEKVYRAIFYGSDGHGYLAGYGVKGISRKIAEWATLVSIEVFLTIFSMFVLFLIRKLPFLGSVTPNVYFPRALGFKQKLLLSFFLVSIIPVAAMGVFSNRFIEDRYKEEARREARTGVRGAVSLMKHSLMSEAELLAGSQYLGDILKGKKRPEIRDVSIGKAPRFTLFTEDRVLLDESLSNFGQPDAGKLLEGGRLQEVTATYAPPNVFGGVVIPIAIPSGGKGYLYYRRILDDEFAEGISRVLGKDVNLYYRGVLKASSQRDLFSAGFLSSLLSPTLFLDVGLGGSEIDISRESVGEYSYQVASVPVEPLRGSEPAVLSVPMIYQPALVQREKDKTFGLLLGVLALLFALAVTLGVFLAEKIFRPIAQLREGTGRIMEGDLEFRLEAEAPDEIGQFVESFNSMTSALSSAREKLMERQKYLTTVMDNIGTGVISSGSDGRIMTLNPAGERILNILHEEIVGQRPSMIERKGLERFFSLFNVEAAGSEEREVVLEVEGERRTIKAVITSLSNQDEQMGKVIVFDDLTELIETKKLSAWVEMARQIAHEVKNPLTPIKLSAQFMKRAHQKGDKGFVEIFNSSIDTIMKHTDVLQRIASEFSSFGRVSKLNIERIELRGFMLEQIAAYRGMNNIEIRFEGEEDTIVPADREALRKIVTNLIENAIEAIEGEGEIEIEVSAKGGRGIIRVTDNGAGLSRQVMGKLFEPYFSTKTTGTGLGLAICKNLLDQMDGGITLRNREEGTGVEAVVDLPLDTGSSD
ncbi:MAG: ATP-binding protein [Candidatus Krumholzibacteriales bacterium]